MPVAEAPEDGIGRRCAMGCATWPDKQIYNICTYCGEPTERCKNVTPMPEDEAKSLKLHYEFEKYCEKRDS